MIDEKNSQASFLTVSSVKRAHGRATLTLSNGTTLTMPRALLRERPYRGGMPFNRESFDALLRERAYPFAMDKAIALLAARARTEKELVDALRQNAYPESIIARVMQRLNEAGYINDSYFAEQWVSSRSTKGLGARRIRMELRQKGVNPDVIDEALAAVDEDDLLDSALKAARKAARGRDLHNPADRQKALAMLARRGFDFSIARRALEQVMQEE